MTQSNRTLSSRTIHTVSAVIADARGRMLLVRKRGSDFLIQPGGKPEPGEADLDALARELAEELGVRMSRSGAVFLGEFEDHAVHEPAMRVRTRSYVVPIDGEPTASAEIAELVWVAALHHPAEHQPVWQIAPLSARHVMPAFRRWRETRSAMSAGDQS